MINHMQQGSENPICSLNCGRSLAFSDKTSGQSIVSKPIQRDVTPDSFVINLDYINEPSTSNSVNSHIVFANRLCPQQYQLNASQVEMVGDSNDPNLLNEREINTNGELHGSRHLNNDNNDGDNSNNNMFSISENNQVAGTLSETPNLRPDSENQSFEKEVLNICIPFLTFLLLMTIYDHREGILIFIGLFITFVHANSVVKREVAKQNRRSFTSLGIIFVYLLISICLLYFIFQDQQLYENLIFIPSYSHSLTIWDVLWIVGITDFVLKFITIQLKVGVVCFPAKLLAFSARGKWYHALECGSQLYRGLVPIQPWLYYLTDVYQGPKNAVGVFFLVAYAASKGSDIMAKFKLFLKAVWKLLQNSSLGSHPTREELLAAGAQCPICHDEYNAPVMLQCKHIFCDSCVSAWFDREQTCPLCRAKIADDPSFRNGATSSFIQLF